MFWSRILKGCRTLLWLIYTVLYLCIVLIGFADDRDNGYPTIIAVPELIIGICVCVTIPLFAFQVCRPAIQRFAKVLFPLAIIAAISGVAMDAFLPGGLAAASKDGFSWLLFAIPAFMCFVPAFFAVHGLAYARLPDTDSRSLPS